MKKKVLKSYLIAAALSMAICACGSVPEEREVITEYASAEAASGKQDAGPEATAAPDAAAKATQEPVSATPEAAEASKAAEATATPDPEETPKTTATPAATATPKATETAAVKVTETPATAVPKETESTETARETAEPKDTTAPPATPEPVHTHTFVDKTVSEATCTEAKVVESVCSVCGESNGTRTEGSALGHVYGYDSWWFEPTCSSGGYKNEICGICGADMGGVSVDPLPHDWEETSTTGYNCVTSGVTRQTCKNCGAPGDSWENGQYGDHTISSWDVTEIDEEALANGEIKYTTYTVTKCTVCNQEF